MSQHDFNIANQGFPSTRADLNAALQALGSNSSGATAPSTTYPYQFWYDSTTDSLKMRDETNSLWITIGAFNQGTGVFTPSLAEAGLGTAAYEDIGFFATAAQGAKADALSGRNLIINGSGRINQRSYVSGTATVGANKFTLDRWFVVTSGQNLTFTGTAAGRTMTAPAGGVSQVIEGSNIVGGTYVINWAGTATCTVGGVARAKGDTFTLTANTNTTVKFSSGTFSEVQVELGSIVTPFERVDIGVELAKCQRYFTRDLGVDMTGWPAVSGITNTRRFFVEFPVSMRSLPTVSGQNAGNIGTLTVGTTTPQSLRLSGEVGSDLECAMSAGLVLDAEIIA